MIKRITSFVRRPTSLNIILNTIGNYLGVFFSVIYVYVLVRALDPASYGVLSVLLSISYVLSSILDFGTPATIYSFLPILVEKRSPDLYRFIKSTFFYQTLFATVVIAVLFVTFPLLDQIFFKTHAPVWELYATAISVLFFIWQNFYINCLYAAKKVFQANLYINIANFIKTVVLFVLIFTKTLSIGTVILTYGIIGPLLFYLLFIFAFKHHLPRFFKADIGPNEFRFKYTLTSFVASQFYNLGIRMDLFLLSYYQLNVLVGYYGLAQKVILTILATIISITQVISPHFTQIKSKRDLWIHLKPALMYLGIPTMLFIMLIFTPDMIFTLAFTQKYTHAIPLAKYMSLAYIVYPALNIPLLFLLYSVRKPAYLLVGNVILFATITFGSYVFVPIYGANAAIFSLFFGFIASGAVLSYGSLREYRKLPN